MRFVKIKGDLLNTEMVEYVHVRQRGDYVALVFKSTSGAEHEMHCESYDDACAFMVEFQREAEA